MARFLLAVVLVALFCAPSLLAQSEPETGGREIQVWTAGGHGLNGSNASTGIWNVGFRYGWIFTPPAGPGILRGRFEFAVDAVPVFVVVQRGRNAYGAGVDPFALKWNFVPRRRISPYIDIGGGTLFTNNTVPDGASRVNFTTSGAVGAHFLLAKYNWSVEVRFMHISNAGLVEPNSGINTLQLRIGFGIFTHRH